MTKGRQQWEEFEKKLDSGTASTGNAGRDAWNRDRQTLKEPTVKQPTQTVTAQQAAYIKEYQRLAGLDLDSYGKQVESAKKAAQDNRTMYNIHAFGAGDYSKAGKAMERGAKTVAAGALGAASSAVEIAGQFTPTSGQQSMGQFSGFGDLGRAVRANREKGTDINTSIRQQEAQRREKQMQSQKQIFSAATRLAEKGQQYETEAKEGLGTVGQFLVDMGVTGTQMAGDALMNLVLPGSGLAMMGLRSYGQAAGEARRAGKTSGQQFLAGLKTAGIEMFTEKMFGAFSKVYGKAGADELVEKLVGKLTKNTAGQALLTWMINAAGEGVEEVTSDLLNPLADRLLGLDNGKGAIYSMDDLAQWGYDFLLGTAMGVLGGGSQLAQGVRQGQAQTAEADYYADLKRSGLGSTGHAANAQKAGNALGRLLPGNDGVAIQRLRMPMLTTYEQHAAAQGAYESRVNDARMVVRQRAGVTGSYQAAEDGKTSYNGQETSVRSVVKDGKVELTTGETVDHKDVQFSDRNTADLYEGAIRTAENAGAAQVFVDSYTGGDVSTYILGMQEAYHNGKEGVPLEDAGGFAADLSDAQRKAAWEQGRAAASVPDLKDYGFGEKGTQAWNKVQENEAVRNNRRLRAGFTAMYQAGMRGESASAVKSDAAKYIPPSVQTAAYQAGLADAAESLARETAAVQFVSSAGSESGLVDNEYSRKLAKEKSGTAALLSMLGKDLGVRVEIVPKVLGGNANGQYVAGRNLVQIAADADNAFAFVAAHEVTHRMQSLAPEEYRSYRDYAMRFRAQELGEEGTVALVERYRSMSEEAGVTLTQEEAMDEITADLTMRMIEDGGLFEDFARENRSEAKKLLDALKAFVQKVKSLFRSKEARDKAAREAYGTDVATLEECVARWQKAYTAAGKAAQNAKTAAGEGSGVKYSLKNIVGDSGKFYGVGVYLDSTLLENLTEKEREQMVKERVKELGGQHFTAYDANGNAVDVQIAESRARFINKNGKSVPVNKDLMTKNRGSKIKQESVVLADELISAARYKKSRPAKYPHGWLDDNGKSDWAEWKTYVQDKENSVWEATLHIATSAAGERFLYDIDPIKMTEQSGNSDTSAVTNSIPAASRNVNAKFSLKGMDSAGRQLSEQQQEYFKDSKVRDAEGRLKPVYHGSDALFTKFSADFMSKNGSSEGQGFYFTDLKTMAQGYEKKGGQLLEGYLDIKNPLSDSKVTLTSAEVKRLIKAIDPTGDDLVLNYDSRGGMGYPSKAWYERAVNDTLRMTMESSESDSEILAELANGMGNPGAVLKAAREVLGYDGYIVEGKYDNATVYVAFDSSQFKNMDNLTPTSDPDIRFQLKSARELEQEVRELKKYAEYRKRGTSDREILTSTADSSAQTEWERKRLAEYKDVMGRLETYERRLSENKAKLEELSFMGEKKNAKRISQLKTEITQDTNRIGIVENKLGELENTSSLKTLLDREKAIIHQQEGEYLRKVEELMGGYRDLYGTMAKGEKAARDIQMPKKTSENEKISQTVRTILEAKATPDEMVPTIEEMALNGEYSYEVYSDKNAISDAEEEIKRVGWAQSLSEWTKAVQKGEVSKKNTAMGWALYNNAANSGDTDTALTILSNMVEHQRSAAQALQATRILKSLSPETQLYHAQRSVDNLQTEMNKRYGDEKAPELKIDPALAEQFIQATDQETRDAVLHNIYRDIGKQMPSRFGDKWNAWRYLAMLGNVRTHVRNVVGNAGFVPVVAAKNVVATGIEKAVYRLSDGKMERSKEFVFGKDGKALLQAAARDYAKIQDVAMGGGKYSDLANANKYIEEGRVIFQSKGPGLKQVSKGLEAARKANSKALDKEDAWFSKPHYAYAMAQYCKANGITPQMVESGKGIEKAREYAVREAQKATYRDTNSFSQAISELGRTVKPGGNWIRKAGSAAMEGILPFRKTPANILVRGVEYSPIGLMNGIKQALFDVRKGTKTAAEAIDSISAGLTGTGLLGLGLFLAAQGLVRGHGSDDEDKNEYAELTGHQAYALELPDGTSITLDWLAPECLPFFIGVNLWEITDGGKEILTMSDALNAVTMVSEPLLEMSCLQSLNDVFDAVGYASSNGLSALPAALANAATSYMTQALPTILGQAERAGENIRYATYTDKNSVLTSDMQYALGRASAKIPGLDYSQIPYIDAWGRRESTGNLGERLLNNFLNPAYVSDVSESEMEKELLRLYKATGEIGVLPSRAGKSFSANNEKINLTGEQYVKYAEKKGGEAYKWMTALTQSNAYRSMSDEEKADCVKYIYEAANEVAKSGIVGSSYEMKTWVKEAVGGAGVVETAIAKTKYADVSKEAVNAYKAFSGSIGEDVFFKTWDALGDITGEDYDGDGRSDAYSKIDKKLEYINGLNLTAQQKRALAIANGINEKTVDKRAPW